jgi:hypothetical protein
MSKVSEPTFGCPRDRRDPVARSAPMTPEVDSSVLAIAHKPNHSKTSHRVTIYGSSGQTDTRKAPRPS